MSWRAGISTGIAYQRPILEVLEPIRNAGFETIEICTAPHHLNLASPPAIAGLVRAVAGLGLRVQALHAPFGSGIDIACPDRPTRERSLARLTRAADVLAELGGSGLYVIHPGSENERWAWDRERQLAQSLEGLNRLWLACCERGLQLVLETPLPHLLGGQLDDFGWLLARIPREGTGVCIDTSHCALGRHLELALTRFAGRIVHTQISDNRGTSDDHLPPGDGTIDWPAFCGGLVRSGYDGVFMLEVAGHDNPVEGLARCAAAIRRILPEARESASSGR